MRVVLFQMPRVIGGGSVEAGASALLWRKLGIDVTVLPAHPGVVDTVWPDRLRDAGCVVKKYVSDDDLVRQAWLFRSTVVGFACQRAVECWDKLARMNCSFVHLPTHCFGMPHEHRVFRHRAPSAVVFESEFQRRQLSFQYTSHGVPTSRQIVINGAFDATEFPYRPKPHHEHEPFVVGVVGRSVGARFNRHLLPILSKAGHNTFVQSKWLGWTPSLQEYSGTPPSWVETFAPGSVPVSDFLRRCHCLLIYLDGCYENWSRVCLEGLASGVSIVAIREGGLVEQLQHEETALLASNLDEAASAIERLANDEQFRMGLISRGRESLKQLADPERIGQQWMELFESLGT